MNTPICDFVKNYIRTSPSRYHMPGHKGTNYLGYEEYDITEIDGADSLYEAEGIIKQSEKNASLLFGCDTYYSTEGSSHCIRAMLYLAKLYASMQNRECTILAARNVHKTFVSGIALLDINTKWIFGEEDTGYLSCKISADYLEKVITSLDTPPTALYITTPDYPGNITDVEDLSRICKKHGMLLLVDSAHGAYLKFLEKSLYPTDLGADICVSSAHKTLPVITGGAYLNISHSISDKLAPFVKDALALFGSTSPSYLILQSLDMANKIISDGFKNKILSASKEVSCLKDKIRAIGYDISSDEPLKITIRPKSYGYTGYEISDILKKDNIICEFCDKDHITFMISPDNHQAGIDLLISSLSQIKRLSPIEKLPPKALSTKAVMSVRDAIMSESEIVNAKSSKGRILSQLSVGCPPAVPVIISGEKITHDTVEAFKYYNIDRISVVKNK